MNTPKWIVILTVVLALAMPATPVGAAPSAFIALTPPTPDPVNVGGETSFSLIIDVIDIPLGVTGADIYLAYDDTLVLPPASPESAVEPLPDFFGPSNITWYEVLPRSQCPGGASPCIHLVTAGPPQITHFGAVARFHFRGIAEGEACFWVLTSTLKNADGYEVAHAPASPVCVIVIRQYTGKGRVLRQGTPGIPNPGGGTLACSIVWSTSGATRYGPISTDDKGDFQLTNLPGGSHTLHAEYPGYLASERLLNLSGDPTTIDVGTTTLRGGDVNGDNKVNILDIGKIISLFGRTGVPVKSDPAEGCADPDEPTDINDDGNINISDLAITAGNWGRTGPTLWQ